MATTTSLGIGAGVDLQSMLTKLMAAERTPITALDKKISDTNSKISVYGTLKSKLSTLQSAANTLYLPTKLSAVTATSSDATVLTASASFNAAIGSYAVNVTQLASAQKDFSNPYATGTTFGQGTLDFVVNGTPQSINLNDKTSYTLQEVRGKINSANIGVTATIISGSDGDRLILTGSNSGASGGFSLTTTIPAPASVPPGSFQSSLASFDTTTVGLARATAQDAKITIDGVAVSSSSNVFSSAVAGLTLTAVKLGTSTVSAQNDSSKITAAVQSFVDGYNAIGSLIKINSTYDASTKTGQPLNGDSAARNIRSTLSNVRTTIPAELSTATYKTLGELGISVQKDGSLSLDSTKLNNAISLAPAEVMKTLSAYGKAFDDSVTGILGSQGLVTNRVNGLNKSIKAYQDNQAALEIRMTNIEKRYRAQFTALDTMVSSMQSTSSYLTQQLSRLP